jgi:hypothetical protein
MKIITYKIFKEYGTFPDDCSGYCRYFIKKYIFGINLGRIENINSDSLPGIKSELEKLKNPKKYEIKIEEINL